MTNSNIATLNGENTNGLNYRRVTEDFAVVAAGLSAGAALMYLYDPDRGRSRRRRIMAKASKVLRRRENSLERRGRDALNRLTGAIAQGLSAMRRHEHADDDVLLERVRSRMGHIIAHGHEIQVAARNGIVTLKGALGHAEKRPLLKAIEAVPGVRRVEDHLSAKSAFPAALLPGLAAGVAAFTTVMSARARISGA